MSTAGALSLHVSMLHSFWMQCVLCSMILGPETVVMVLRVVWYPQIGALGNRCGISMHPAET